MTITLELPENTTANLNERAQVEGRPVAELAMEAIMDRYGADNEEDYPLEADTVEKIRRGLEEINSGQTMSLEEARVNFKAVFSERYRDGSA
jgi:predicted DNA-binding protein